MDSKIVYSTIENEMAHMLYKNFTSISRLNYVKANDVTLPEYFKDYGQRILDMEVRDDDIWVCTYPKAGTTWTQEMIWCIANDLDFEGAKQILPERFPFLEHSIFFYQKKMLLDNPNLLEKFPLYLTESIDYVESMKSPRFIKTHLPYKLLPKNLRNQSTKAKIICVARNAKDTCLSYFHHQQLLQGYIGNFEDFCKLFISDSISYSPFFEHILGYWARKNDPNVIFLKYEDMKQDLCSVIRKIAQFLDKELHDDQVLVLADHLSFESMKNNRAVNFEPLIEIVKNNSYNDANRSFIRSGKVGEGKQKMLPEFVKMFDEWEKKCLEKSKLTF